jgi:hypothetical protein
MNYVKDFNYFIQINFFCVLYSIGIDISYYSSSKSILFLSYIIGFEDGGDAIFVIVVF